jgi:hypothetical protein
MQGFRVPCRAKGRKRCGDVPADLSQARALPGHTNMAMWKTCGRRVNFLWSKRQEIFFFAGSRLIDASGRNGAAFRTLFRLFRFSKSVEFRAAFVHHIFQTLLKNRAAPA